VVWIKNRPFRQLSAISPNPGSASDQATQRSARYDRSMTSWSEQPLQIGAITLFVENLPEAKEFYRRVFDLPVRFEDANSVVFRFGDMLVNLLRVTVAGELISPATVAHARGGAQFEFTISVEDVDAACIDLKARGVTLLNGPIDRPWGIRTASFADPDGHIWEIAQDLP